MKSSRCDSNTCVEVAFRRSSQCDTYGDACVEVAVGDVVLVRDSKNPDGPVLSFDASEWSAFLAGVRSNEFDL
jgi:uncharacterized protein DUF397